MVKLVWRIGLPNWSNHITLVCHRLLGVNADSARTICLRTEDSAVMGSVDFIVLTRNSM